jgi:TatD DNase family protein
MSAPAWVDSHCHLYMTEADPASLMARARQAGVGEVMVPGVDLATSLQARHVAGSASGTWWSAGLHPHEAARWSDEGARITALAADADAVGECGLDYYRNLAPPDVQRETFDAQLRVAADYGKPIIVHCRDAFGDVYDRLEEADLGERAVLHCWTGGPKWTKRFAALGVTFSFAGPITYPTGDTVRRAAAVAPQERTMVETDTPYLTPPPRRDRQNEPANVVRVGEALAAAWSRPVEETAMLTTATARRVFGPAT